jgi:hypothetical protein
MLFRPGITSSSTIFLLSYSEFADLPLFPVFGAAAMSKSEKRRPRAYGSVGGANRMPKADDDRCRPAHHDGGVDGFRSAGMSHQAVAIVVNLPRDR